jgi:hypothetical protein
VQRKDDSEPEVTAKDRRLIDAIARTFRPDPVDPARRAAFRREIEERLERPDGRAWEWAIALATTSVAAVFFWLWFASVPQGPPAETAATEERAPAAGEDQDLYAFTDPDDDGDAAEPEDYLPDEYLALASYLDAAAADL